MAIEMRRLTFTEQISRSAGFRGRSLAMEIRGPKGFGTRAVEALNNLPVLLAAKDVELEFYTPLGCELNVSALIGKTAEEIDDMAAQIDALSQAAATRTPQVARSEMIDDLRLPFRVAKDVVPGSLSSGRAIAQEINQQETGCKLRIPTEPELLELNRLLGGKLGGADYWIWTETEHEDYPGQFVLRLRLSGVRLYLHPEVNCDDFAVRLVEDR
jgi:hypothetical protein